MVHEHQPAGKTGSRNCRELAHQFAGRTAIRDVHDSFNAVALSEFPPRIDARGTPDRDFQNAASDICFHVTQWDFVLR